MNCSWAVEGNELELSSSLKVKQPSSGKSIVLNTSILELMPAEVQAQMDNGEEPDWEPEWQTGFVLGTLDFGGFQTIIPTTSNC